MPNKMSRQHVRQVKLLGHKEAQALFDAISRLLVHEIVAHHRVAEHEDNGVEETCAADQIREAFHHPAHHNGAKGMADEVSRADSPSLHHVPDVGGNLSVRGNDLLDPHSYGLELNG